MTLEHQVGQRVPVGLLQLQDRQIDRHLDGQGILLPRGLFESPPMVNGYQRMC